MKTNRKTIGVVSLILGGISLMYLMMTYVQHETITSLPDWANSFVGAWSWVWLFASFIALFCMVFDVNSIFINRFAVFAWVVMTAIAICDILITKDRSTSHLTTIQGIAGVVIFLGLPIINFMDVFTLVDTANRNLIDVDHAKAIDVESTDVQ